MALLKDIENMLPLINQPNEVNTSQLDNQFNMSNLQNNNNNDNNNDDKNLHNIFNIYKKNLFDIGIKSQEEIKTDKYQTFIKTNTNTKNIPHINPKPFTHFSTATFDERLTNPASFGPLSKRYKVAQLKQFLDQNTKRQEMKKIVEEDLNGLFNFY